MPIDTFTLSVEGKSADARSLMCHFQAEPHPGGLQYRLAIHDGDVITEGTKLFGLGKHHRLESRKQSSFLSYLFPMIGLKCGRSKFQFWANTIDEVELSENVLILRGVCSRNVSCE
jgi:hypothetical protein